ncbi:MAG: chloride channel protein [Elusimicrobiaceae bacterium]|nr:chloride channel protein [Elusimicrobiaceae bacterium]
MRRIAILQRKITFLNILKWFLLALLIGVIVGICNAMFLKLLEFSIGFTNQFEYYFLVLPFALYLVNKLAKMSPEDNDYSTNQAIASINERKGVSLISALKAFFLPIITIACGGSAGKESPCADVGAGVASTCAKIFSFNKQERRKLMICGVSAGFAGVFGVPISGALFGLEVLSVGTVFYEVMFPAFIAGITSFQVTHALGVNYIYHPLNLKAISLDGSLFMVVLAGLFFGVVALILIEIMKLSNIIMRYVSSKTNMLIRCFVASSVVILIGLLTSPDYLGLTMNRIDIILSGGRGMNLGFLIKIIATAFTFAGGGVGGLVTPVFFIGANSGYFFANLIGLNTSTFAALGLVSVLAGAANTPLAASIMAIELFGASIAPYAAVSCIVSFLVTGQRSIYPKQEFSFNKNLIEDDKNDPLDSYTTEQLEKALVKKNFILQSIRHLLPNSLNKKEIDEIVTKSKENKKDFQILKHLFPNFDEKKK